MTTTAAIVLAGGRSRRMGTPKANLAWHGSTLLRRAVGIAGRAVDGPVVVVRAPGQDLPPLPASVEVVDDAREDRGPLQGIAAGLRALTGRAQAAYVTSTDAPLLHPAFVRHVLRALTDEHDAVLPVAHGHRHPLAAAYRTSLLPVVDELVAQDRPGNPLGLRGLDDLARPGLRYVNRQRGAGTRVLLDLELADRGIDPAAVAGYAREEHTHLAVAAAVAAGRADCGLGVLAAARAYGLGFVAVAREPYDLVCDAAALRDPALAPLWALLGDGGFRASITALGGYDVAETGRRVR